MYKKKFTRLIVLIVLLNVEFTHSGGCLSRDKTKVEKFCATDNTEKVKSEAIRQFWKFAHSNKVFVEKNYESLRNKKTRDMVKQAAFFSARSVASSGSFANMLDYIIKNDFYDFFEEALFEKGVICPTAKLYLSVLNKEPKEGSGSDVLLTLLLKHDDVLHKRTSCSKDEYPFFFMINHCRLPALSKKIDVNWQSRINKTTALMCASHNANVGSVEMLVCMGANCSAMDAQGLMAEDYVVGTKDFYLHDSKMKNLPEGQEKIAACDKIIDILRHPDQVKFSGG